jgi:hypothetical protein
MPGLWVEVSYQAAQQKVAIYLRDVRCKHGASSASTASRKNHQRPKNNNHVSPIPTFTSVSSITTNHRRPDDHDKTASGTASPSFDSDPETSQRVRSYQVLNSGTFKFLAESQRKKRNKVSHSGCFPDEDKCAFF